RRSGVVPTIVHCAGTVDRGTNGPRWGGSISRRYRLVRDEPLDPTCRGRRRVRTRFDQRLGTFGTPTRRHLVAAVVAGLAQTVTVVVQAVLLATVIERCLQSGADLGRVTPQLIGLGVAITARGGLGWVGEWIAQRTSASVAAPLRRRLLSSALDLGPSWLAGERAGELALTSTR